VRGVERPVTITDVLLGVVLVAVMFGFIFLVVSPLVIPWWPARVAFWLVGLVGIRVWGRRRKARATP
jgi:hypothetical protein